MDLVLYLYSLLCFVCPSVICQLIHGKSLRGKDHRIRHIIWTYIFILYCYLAACDAAGIGTMWDIINYGKIEGSVNFIPFQSDGCMTYILNIIMFMPLGFLLPLIWKDYRQIKRVAVTGLCFSLIIEVCQLFCFRATDVDDLLMNTLGTITGYLIWTIFHKLFRNSGEKSITMWRAEPVCYFVFGVLGIFFLYNWRLFY